MSLMGIKDFISKNAPYAVTCAFFAVLLIIRFSDITWISGLTNNHLSVHILLEFIGILVSFAVFTVGWATYQNALDSDILILSIASFAVGALDMGHTLSFTGMPDFFGPSGPNKSIDFWFASRATGSFAFLYVALAGPRFTARLKYVQWILFGVALAWVSLCFWAILVHLDWLPTFFIQGGGLSPSKRAVEWILVAISCIAGALLFYSAERRENINVKWMGCASLLYGMCGYFFTIYQDFNDLFVFSGHCFKAISYLVLYRAVFVECVSRPYQRARQLATEAQASNLSKSRFLANVSHEFRTPLGVISGFGDLILGSEKLDPSLIPWTQTIVRNSKLLSMLIDDLLDLAKAETEKIQIHAAQFDLLQLVKQVKESLEMHKNHMLDFQIENKLGENTFISSDELRIRQILNNVVGNAMKFTSAGRITIVLQRLESNLIEVLIEDSGIGIPANEIDRLFQPFSQVSNPKNRRFGGTGLGLSLSRKLAELLGGNLVLRWSVPGKGSCFSLSFHDQRHENVEIESKEINVLTLKQAPSFAGRKVLIAEDSIDNQLLLNNYLKNTEIDITFAENGRVALNLARTTPFDLILMDIQMPEMDGFEATIELRKTGWSGQIVALTAHALQPERDRAMQNGFNNYLVKPIKKEVLWTAMAQSLRDERS